jgi:superfamily I DNA and RNA helicase
VWRQRTFGHVELWNSAIDDAGNSLGLPADEVPDAPLDDGVVLFESVRRFKGLEREVVILCELPDETAERFDQLLYTAFTRATTYLVVIASASLVARLAHTPAAPTDPR